MPIRGESVGTAYVKVVADGRSIPDDIRDAFNDADRVYDDAGNVGAKRYKAAFAKELETHTGRSLDDALMDALAKDDFTKEFFESDNWRKFEKNMHARFGRLGSDAAFELREKFLERGSLDGLLNDVSRVTADINAKLKQQARDLARATEEENARIRRVGEEFRAFWLSADDDIDRTGNAFTRFFSRLRSGRRDTDRATTVFGRLGSTIDHLALGIGRAFGRGSRNDFLNFVGSFIGNASRLVGLPFKILDNIGQFTKGFRTAMAAGQGFFGAMSKGFTTMAADAEGGATALSGALSSIVIALPALAVALGAIILILSTIASLISGIIAAIIALASTLSFGLVAALATVGALLPPIALGIGTVILGIATMDSKTKKALTNSLKPFVDQLKDLGQTAREGFLQTFNADLDKTADKLRIFHPLVEAIGEGFGNIANNIADSLDSPTLRRFLNIMERFVPDALESMSTIAGNVGRAVLEIFSDSVPLASDFLGWLEKITGQFANFITGNPRKVTKFLEDAAGSAKQIGDFLGAAGRVLGDLLFSKSGKKAGDTIFGDLTDALNAFDEFLDKHPDALGEFFANGVVVARGLGRIALAAIAIFDAFDSDEGRDNIKFTLDTLASIGELAKPIAVVVGILTQAQALALGNFISALHAIGDFFGHINANTSDDAEEFAHAIGSVIDGIGRLANIRLPELDLGRRIKDFFKNALKGFGGPGGGTVLAIRPPSLEWIPGTLNKIGNFWQKVMAPATTVHNVIGGALRSLGGIAASAVGDINQAFARIPVAMARLQGRIVNAVGGWAIGILSRLSDVPQNIVDFFQGLGARIARAIGSIHLNFDFPSPPSWLSKVAGPGGALLDRFTASGGIFNGAQLRIIGEAGAEAVVPLTGPLDAVDPSVRALSALARGLAAPTGSVSQTAPGKTINVEQHITTPATDPVAAAQEFLNHLTAVVA